MMMMTVPRSDWFPNARRFCCCCCCCCCCCHVLLILKLKKKRTIETSSKVLESRWCSMLLHITSGSFDTSRRMTECFCALAVAGRQYVNCTYIPVAVDGSFSGGTFSDSMVKMCFLKITSFGFSLQQPQKKKKTITAVLPFQYEWIELLFLPMDTRRMHFPKEDTQWPATQLDDKCLVFSGQWDGRCWLGCGGDRSKFYYGIKNNPENPFLRRIRTDF
jgi:hypothetical protein